jgi:ribosomal protein S18 acetylase RimI-like enzyme
VGPKGDEPHENGGSVPNGALSPALEQSVNVTAVRTLSVPDISRASAMLAHTFEESPLFRCAFSDPGRRRRASNAIFRAAVKDGLRFGRVFLARNPEIVGALITYGPGGYPLSVFRKIRQIPEYARVATADLRGFVRIVRAQATVEKLHPSEPHLYVYFVGVARGEQRRGVGRALAKFFLSEADADRLPIYGETQERSNAEWYKRLGCRILREGVPMYRGGPPTWTMWRDPNV